VFGGDVAFPQPDAPVLIDLNDWPSFAPVRVAAAAAIAGYIDEQSLQRTSRMIDLVAQSQLAARLRPRGAKYLAPGTQSVAALSKLCMDRGEGAILWTSTAIATSICSPASGVASLGYAHPRYVAEDDAAARARARGELHVRASRGAGEADRGTRARRLEPHAALLERGRSGRGRRAARESSHRPA